MQEKPCVKVIPAIYRSQAEDLLLFGFVEGVRRVVPSAQQRQAVVMFLEYFNIDEDSWSLDLAVKNYQATRDKFRQNGSQREKGI